MDGHAHVDVAAWNKQPPNAHTHSPSSLSSSPADVDHAGRASSPAASSAAEDWDDTGFNGALGWAPAGAPWLDGAEQDVSQDRLDGAYSLTSQQLRDVRSFAWAIVHGVKPAQFNAIPAFFDVNGNVPTWLSLQASIQKLSSPVKPLMFDCCSSSCVCFAGDFAELGTCPFCAQPRRNATGQPSATFTYIPLRARPLSLMASRSTGASMAYRATEFKPAQGNGSSDVFDGKRYKTLLKTPRATSDGCYFSDDRDVALGLSTDGFCPFRGKNATCWPLLIHLLNLPPEIRSHTEHILCVGLIPGPQQPKHIDSFLAPLVDELLELDRGVVAWDAVRNEQFVLRAHLLLAFGDMPAVAKVMGMKGPNGRRPCRACEVEGVRKVGTSTHYVPLALGRNWDAHVDPLDLPYRTPERIREQAQAIRASTTEAEAGRRRTEYGINHLPRLADLPTISIPFSFPIDFMHLAFENVTKLLIKLWLGEVDGLANDRNRPFYLPRAVWREIGERTAAAGDTIPTAFGGRIPNVDTRPYEMTADNWSFWLLFMAPILLANRFKSDRYYKHLLLLVDLFRTCLQFEVGAKDIARLRVGFAGWVKDFERLYGLNDPTRISIMTLNIHCLLHISDYILACGPVWVSWSFSTERYCGKLARMSKSQKLPYASLTKKLVDIARLDFIRDTYSLHETLAGRRSPAGSASSLTTSTSSGSVDPTSAYPLHVPIKPCADRLPFSLQARLQEWIARYLHGQQPSAPSAVSPRQVGELLEAPLAVRLYCKVQRLEGGDLIEASQTKSTGASFARDKTWVKFTKWRDKRAHIRRGAPDLVEEERYGSVDHLLVVKTAAVDNIPALDLMLADIKPAKITRTDALGTPFYERTEASALVDVNFVEGLVGRVWNGREWGIIERSSEFRALLAFDDADDVAAH